MDIEADESGEEERARELEIDATGSGCFDDEVKSEWFFNKEWLVDLPLRLEEMTSRAVILEETELRKTAADDCESDGWMVRARCDDARAKACAAVALAASLVYNQSCT